tara:strand:+ start:1174 stop:1749 length:576 start_codon:yes stop_codon:yes gene_type:complete
MQARSLHCRNKKINFKNQVNTQLKLVENIEKQIIALGNLISWLALFLVIIVCLSVFLRYVLGLSNLGFDELQWHIYSFGFMMGFSYCTSMETHIRNDLFYSKFSEKTKLWIDLVSHVVVLLPFIIVIIYHSWFFMMRAYVTAEGSIDPGGLPHRWIIKSVLVLSFVLFGIATVARSIAIMAKLRKLTGDTN